VLLLSAAALLVGGLLVLILLVANPLASTSATRPIATPNEPPPAADLVHGRSLGSPDAPAKLIVWSDFQCPVCDNWATTLEPLVRSTFVAQDQLQLTYRDFAFIGAESVDAAIAARAADELAGDFWAYHDLLFANQGLENSGAFSRDFLASLAVSLGIDRAAFLAALDDPTLRQAVLDETTQGSALGVNSTPTLQFGDTLHPGIPTWATLTDWVNSAVAASPSPSSSSEPSSSPSPGS
jgi:protein-disulfide isomerase